MPEPLVLDAVGDYYEPEADVEEPLAAIPGPDAVVDELFEQESVGDKVVAQVIYLAHL